MLRTVVTTYLARFASMISYFALLPMTLNAYGADLYGVYALTVAMTALFQQDLGMGNATTRFAAVAHAKKDDTELARVSSAAWVFYVATAVVMSVGLLIALWVTLANMDTTTAELSSLGHVLAVLAAANVFSILVTAVNRQILSGIGALTQVNLALIVQAVMRVAMTAAVIFIGWSIIAVAAVDLIVTVLTGILVLALRRRFAPGLRIRLTTFRWSTFRTMFAVSSQLLVVALASTAIMQAGSVIAAVTLPVAAIAFYAAGQRMYVLVKEVTGSLAVAVLPHASSVYAKGGSAANARTYLLGTQAANMLMMLVLVPVVCFMPLIMRIWVGPESQGAVIVAQVLILSMLANNNHLLALPLLTADGSIKSYAILHTIWALTGITLATLLSGPLGIAGIALGIAIPVLVLEPLYIVIVLRRLSVNGRDFARSCLVRPFALVALPAFGVAFYALYGSPTLVWAILVSAAWVVIAAALYLTIGLDREARQMLTSRIPSLRRARP